MKTIKAVSLFFTEGSSDKVYNIQLQEGSGGYVVNFQYGRRNSALKPGSKTATPVEESEANKIFDKLVSEKRSKGYTLEESGETFSTEEFKAKKTDILPQLLNPIDPSELEKHLMDSNFVAQEKFDGERRLIAVRDGNAVGINRKGLEVPLSDKVRKCFAKDAVLDAEIIGDTVYVFDVLEVENEKTSTLSVLDRLEILEKMKFGKNVKIVKTAKTTTEKRALLKKVQAENGEGIVFKKKDSIYSHGRPSSGGNALKYKLVKSATFITGEVTKNKRSVGLILMDKGEEVEVGKVTILPNFPVPAAGSLIEVQYLYAYKGGAVFQPVYRGERTDLEVTAATLSQLIYKKESDEEDEV